MRVVLVAPHWLHIYGEFRALSKVVNFHPPLGLCALAAAVERHGHHAEVIDAEGEGLGFAALVDRVVAARPDLVGITVTTPILPAAARLARALRARLPTVPLVAGGPHVTLTGTETLATIPELDYSLAGEGETTLPALLDLLTSGGDPDAIPGLHWREGERIGSARAPLVALDLDALPFPDRTKVPVERYLWSVPGVGLVPTTTIQASRGCPLRCIFCSEDRIHPTAIRFKSVERVLEELETIRRTTPARHLVFLDDTITLDRRWALRLFTEMARARFGFTWEGETTANRLDEELVAAMAAAGLRRMNLGIESGDPAMLARLGKGVPLEAFAPAYRLLKRHGVETRGSVVIGNPYETRRSVRRTLWFLWRLRDLDQAYVNIAAPYPGTLLREMALRGEGGTELLDPDYAALRRYGGGVLRVNDLTPERLARYQRWGLLWFHLRPRRLVYNLRRAGWRAMWRNLVAAATIFVRRDAPRQLPGFAS